MNVEGGRFATVSAVSGLDYPDDARAIAVVDWDQDGDLDLWISNRNSPRLRMMRNDSTNDRHWLALRLIGNGTSTNRDAIGARVEVVSKALEDKRLIRTLRAGEGLLAQSSKLMHFGLGELDQVEEIIVRWPGGEVETFEEIEVDARFELKQGTGRAELLDSPVRTLALQPTEQPNEKVSSAVRVPMVTLLPLPRKIGYTEFDGKQRTLELGSTGKPTLIVLWASWCSPCRQELADLVSRENEIRSAGIEVVALSVDGLSDDGTEPTAAQALCDQLNFKFASGRSTPELVQMLTAFHHMLIALKKPLPVPSSFLVDRQGRLSVIYKGQMDIDQVLKDARQEPQSMRERSERAAFLPGRTIDQDSLMNPMRRTEANTLCGLATGIANGGQFADSIPLFRAALANEPDFGEAHQGLAYALESTNQFQESATEYQLAIQQFPDRDILHFHLGNVWIRLAKWEEAFSSFSATIRLNPRYWEAFASRANVLMKLNRQAEAAADFRQVLKLNPNFAPARQALNLIEAKQRP